MATGPIRCGCQFGRQKDGGGAVSAADNGNGRGFFGKNPRARALSEGKKDAHLGRCPQQHQFGPGQQGGKVGHRPQPQKDNRGINTRGHAEIEIVQHAVGFVNPKPNPLKKGNVAHQDAEADGQQQQGFVLLGNGKVNKETSDNNHYQMSRVGQSKTGI